MQLHEPIKVGHCGENKTLCHKFVELVIADASMSRAVYIQHNEQVPV
jgi:hypothetical protein